MAPGCEGRICGLRICVGSVLDLGQRAAEDPATVVINDFGLSEGLVVESDVVGDVKDGQGELAVEAHVIGHFAGGAAQEDLCHERDPSFLRMCLARVSLISR